MGNMKRSSTRSESKKIAPVERKPPLAAKLSPRATPGGRSEFSESADCAVASRRDELIRARRTGALIDGNQTPGRGLALAGGSSARNPCNARTSIAERSAGNLLDVPWIEPEDVAAAVLYLASDRARFITGSQFVLDAGLLSR